MKKIWVFRHGPKETGSGKNVIATEVALKNPEGVEATKRLAEIFLRGQTFKSIFTSPLVRAYQTGVIFALALGINYPKIAPGLAGLNLNKWEEIVPHLKGHTCVDFYEAVPNLLETDGDEVFKTITLAAKTLFPGEQAICVGHGGLIESAMAAAVSSRGERNFEEILRSITDLKEGEAVIFFFDDDNNFIGYEEKRLL